MYLLGFVSCLGLTIVAIQLLAKGLEGILQSARINIINKFFGGVLMAAIFVLMYSVLLWMADSAHLVAEKTKIESATYKILKEYPSQVKVIWTRVQPTLNHLYKSYRFSRQQTPHRSKQKPDFSLNIGEYKSLIGFIFTKILTNIRQS